MRTDRAPWLDRESRQLGTDLLRPVSSKAQLAHSDNNRMQEWVHPERQHKEDIYLKGLMIEQCQWAPILSIVIMHSS